MFASRSTAHGGTTGSLKGWTFPSIVLLIGITALYVAAARAGLAYAVVGSTVTLVWAPSGIALAALLVFGRRAALAVAFGAFLANAGTGIPILAACSIAAGNTLEALAGAWLLLRIHRFDVGLKTRRDVLALIGLAAILSPILSASVGTATLAWAGNVATEDHAIVWLQWWLGDMMGVLVVAPPLLLATRVSLRPPTLRKFTEAFVLAAALLIVCLKIFGDPQVAASQYFDAPLAVFPFVVWGALRFGQLGAGLVTLVFSFMAVWGSSRGIGPFSTGNSFTDLVQWCAFSIVVAGVGLVLAASVAEHQRAEAERMSVLEKLQHHVEERTRDLLAANAGLRQEMAERRSLEIALISVSEEQRRAIGSELHDGLGQHLTSISLLCAGLRQSLAGRAQPEAEAMQRIEQLIGEAAAMNRSAAHGLYPVEFQHAGLIPALERMAEEISSRQAMKCVVSGGRDVQVADPMVAINLYRIAQEAVNNAVKHSQAGLLLIDLFRVNGEYRLSLRDDGIGLDTRLAAADTGMGIYSMRYRAHLLGGTLQVTGNVPQGTTVIVTYPDQEGPL